MAGIDHTIIAYKNGKLMKDTVRFTEDDQCISLVPFSYNRDGIILGYDMGRSYPYWLDNATFADKLLRVFASHEDNYPRYFSFMDKTLEIILCEYADFNVTIYMDAEDSYVMIGGYGHYLNPYTHFYHRGYGEDFERKMAQECFDWLCHDILDSAVHSIPCYKNEAEHHLLRIQTRIGYKDYFDMSDEERAKHDAGMDYYDAANDRVVPVPLVNGLIVS